MNSHHFVEESHSEERSYVYCSSVWTKAVLRTVVKILSSTSFYFGKDWNYLKKNILLLLTTDSKKENGKSVMLVNNKSSLSVCLP